MILDYLENGAVYSKTVPELEKALAFGKSLFDKPAGHYETDGGMFANVQEGETYDIDQDKYESHRQYLDVQIVVKGSETLDWEDISRLELTDDFEKGKDFAFYRAQEGTRMVAAEGMFYIMFPHDGHRCRGIVGGKPEYYKKMVVKIPLCEA